MSDPSNHSVTELLNAWRGGDKRALDRLMPMVQQKLREIAKHYMANERPNHTLQPTALVNEAYMKLIGRDDVDWKSRGQFFGLAAEAMRCILVDHARNRGSRKRGGDLQRVTLPDSLSDQEDPIQDLLTLNAALDELAKEHPRRAQVIVLRVFGGHSVEESAEFLSVSTATVKRDYSKAESWLKVRLRGG